MKIHTYAENAYRTINMDEVFNLVQTIGYKEALSRINTKVEKEIRFKAAQNNDDRVAVQVKNCQKWIKEDVLAEYCA
jgi:hypothetical protein